MKHILEITLAGIISGMYIGITVASIVLTINKIKEAIKKWEGWHSIFEIFFALSFAILFLCGTLYLLLYL